MLAINTLEEACAAAWRGAYRGLRSQGWAQSTNDDGMCAYRGEGGIACAAGWLCVVPPDEGYTIDDSDLKGVVWADPIERMRKDHPLVYMEWIRFVGRLQNAHDYADSETEMRETFDSIGRERGWSTPS